MAKNERLRPAKLPNEFVLNESGIDEALGICKDVLFDCCNRRGAKGFCIDCVRAAIFMYTHGPDEFPGVIVDVLESTANSEAVSADYAVSKRLLQIKISNRWKDYSFRHRFEQQP